VEEEERPFGEGEAAALEAVYPQPGSTLIDSGTRAASWTSWLPAEIEFSL
jgi:hypothetical protein